MSFAQSEYARKKKKTRRERFLGEMEQVVPWAKLVGLIEPHYPTGRRGRPTRGIEWMLRMYFLQQWYTLADEVLEDAIYDSQALRTFAGIDLSVEDVPDATTLLKFRHLLEEHELTKAILSEINRYLSERQLIVREGTIIGACGHQAQQDQGDARGRVRVSAQRREALLDEFEKSGGSGMKFARLVGIKYSTCAHWVKQRREGPATTKLMACGASESGGSTANAVPVRLFEALLDGTRVRLRPRRLWTGCCSSCLAGVGCGSSRRCNLRWRLSW